MLEKRRDEEGRERVEEVEKGNEREREKERQERDYFIYIHIYIYRERERDSDEDRRGGENQKYGESVSLCYCKLIFGR